ncbi:hypothetical protein ASPWEDRAFT_102560 [Aspergillus wentii DTO 134E9]|uniref:Xylanolytic transcriptional activator regulatory domain-containing protein n=1 Tax=Aspergillus wentii DTO 134E9 TaxID=1073089 RepID=A0A1L9S0Z0_ASPWE|nr:uncharacterized protein ASPWEDRAFT_102560 [Aspergillus wentii DTO 134E9]OJJ40830.1 hypothetical protein ASPWEDRAFT_102560 [Aspergillus wentii DTO 134E9]
MQSGFQCSCCQTANATCTFSKKLKRRTKPRRHVEQQDKIIENLKIQNEKLKQQLEQVIAINSKPGNPGGSTLGANVPRSPHFAQAQLLPFTLGSGTSDTLQESEQPIIKHLGRLVSSSSGTQRFAGSTTGIHFIHSAEKVYKTCFNTAEEFPEPVYRLHCLGPLTRPHQTEPHVNQSELQQPYFVLDGPRTSNGSSLNHSNECHIYYEKACQLARLGLKRGDLTELQSVILTCLYLQITRHHSTWIQTSGQAVRLAQSLGLHRHARRFTFCRGDVELRKRVWWCVYAVDIASSIVHGLPKVIQDDDVDNDLPVDADLEDCTATEIPLPLPGESTNFGIFITYIKLLRIMSTCLKTLYTTTKRRNGVAKITALDQELSVWRNSIGNFKDRDTASEHEKGIVEDVYANSSYHAFEIPFLHLLSNVCMLLIHLPALTFEPAHPQFAKSLGSSVRAGLNILIILSRNHSNRRVDCLLPNRESLAFQSALVCFYHQWVSRVSSLPSMLDINISLEKVTGAAIELLNAQKTELVQMDTSPAREIDHTTLSTTIEFIESLCSRTKQLFHDYTPTPIPPTQQQAPSFLQEQFNPFSDFGNEADDIAGLGALGELNQLEFAWDDGLFNFETE